MNIFLKKLKEGSEPSKGARDLESKLEFAGVSWKLKLRIKVIVEIENHCRFKIRVKVNIHKLHQNQQGSEIEGWNKRGN